MSDDAILFDRVRGNRSVGAALAAGRSADRNATLSLLIVIDAFHHEVATTGADTVYRRAAECPARLLLGNGAGDYIDEVVRVACFKRHVFPNPSIDQCRKRGIFRLHKLLTRFHRYLLAPCADFKFQIARRCRTDTDNEVLNPGGLKTFGLDFEGA